MNERMLSVRELTNGEEYVIPIYQRDFAWTPAELERLVSDIEESRIAGAKEYYIGTLVSCSLDDGAFEVIDGQQRLTAISLLLLLHEGGDRINLRYEARPESEEALRSIEGGKIPSYSEHPFYSSWRMLKEALKGASKEEFFSYLLDHTFILRSEIPEGSNLNRHFEAMNSRKRQCEETDVLFDVLQGKLADERERKVLRAVWDGISFFSGHAEERIPAKLWNRMLYGEGWAPLMDSSVSDWWKMIKTHVEGKDEGLHGSIEDALSFFDDSDKEERTPCEKPGDVSSLLNFPEFLLISTEIIADVHLPSDDKLFIKSIPSMVASLQTADDVRAYAQSLLIIRHLFDTAIIKASHSSWTLSRYVDKNEYAPTYQDENGRISIIESLYASTLDSDWIKETLAYLYGNRKAGGKELLSFLESLLDIPQGERYQACKKEFYVKGKASIPHMVPEDGKLIKIF